MPAPRLVVDPALGALARLLRRVGFEVEVTPGPESPADGIVVTADRVRSNRAFHQAREVLRALDLTVELDCEASADRAMREFLVALQDDPLLVGHALDEDEDDTTALLELEPLVDLHQVMELLLVRHRLALMRADTPLALSTFRRFARCMRRHVADESERVLPVYRRLEPEDGFLRGGAPDIFDNEHAKILRFLDRIESWTERTRGEPVACLDVLDREKIFADLLEHHDTRERAFLYPALALALDEGERRELVERMIVPAVDDVIDR
jgi:hemerythrin-like domain-containing protein